MSTSSQPRPEIDRGDSQQRDAHSHPVQSSTPDASVAGENGVPLARFRRAPRIAPFLIAGASIGAIVGLLIAVLGGEGGNYTDASSTAYLVVLCAALGSMLGGVAFAIADRRA